MNCDAMAVQSRDTESSAFTHERATSSQIPCRMLHTVVAVTDHIAHEGSIGRVAGCGPAEAQDLAEQGYEIRMLILVAIHWPPSDR